MSLVASRYSCRRYRPDPVPRELIGKMIEAARLAPSSCNRQPWRFAVVTRASLRKRLAARGFLPGMNLSWVAAAPVLIVMGVRRTLLTHRVAPLLSGIDYAAIDLGIAGEHLVLQAAELGLGSCWIGWIKPGTIRKLLGWPPEIRPAIVFTVGWPDLTLPREATDRLPAEAIAQWFEEEPQ